MRMRKRNIRLFKIIFLFIITSFCFYSCNTTKAKNDFAQERIQNELADLEIIEVIGSIETEEVAPKNLVEVETNAEVDKKTEAGEEIIIEQIKNPEPKTAFTREQQIFEDIKNTEGFKEIGADLDYKITVNHETKEIILLFEHTNGNEDWKNNYLFFAWPLNLDGHIVWTSYGYAKEYRTAKNIPFDAFYRQVEKYPDYKVIIRGWSLGSAMAKIAARQFSYRAPKGKLIDELTTFGDVKCWYNPFYSVKKYCKRIREYVNSNDYITWFLPFCRRDVTCRVGEKFSFKRMHDGDYLHEHYEEFDYSKWEED